MTTLAPRNVNVVLFYFKPEASNQKLQTVFYFYLCRHVPDIFFLAFSVQRFQLLDSCARSVDEQNTVTVSEGMLAAGE